MTIKALAVFHEFSFILPSYYNWLYVFYTVQTFQLAAQLKISSLKVEETTATEVEEGSQFRLIS